AAAPCPNRATPTGPVFPAATKPAEAAANASSPPSSTGRGPIRSASTPKTGLSSTSAPSYTASSKPKASSPDCVNPPKLAATLCAPNAVTNPAADNGATREPVSRLRPARSMCTPPRVAHFMPAVPAVRRRCRHHWSPQRVPRPRPGLRRARPAESSRVGRYDAAAGAAAAEPLRGRPDPHTDDNRAAEREPHGPPALDSTILPINDRCKGY